MKFVFRAIIGPLAVSVILFVFGLFAPLLDFGQALTRVPAEIERLSRGQDQIRSVLAEATGSNRITFQPPGQTYVAEPVHFGDPVVLVLPIHLRADHEHCRLDRFSPMFSQEGQRHYGDPIEPQWRMRPEITRFRLSINQPPHLESGRATLTLEMRFMCDGAVKYEETAPVVFTILTGSEGPG